MLLRVLFALAVLFASSQSWAQDAHDCLPKGDNRDLVVANCTACHSAKIICQQRLPRDKWDSLITWMQQTQNLWPIPPDSRNKILDYLEKHNGPGKAGAKETKPAADGGFAPPSFSAPAPPPL